MFPKDTEQCRLNTICEALSTVVHVKRIAVLFLSTIFLIFQHPLYYGKGKLLICASIFQRVRIVFLNNKERGFIPHCRSPPSDFDFAS